MSTPRFPPRFRWSALGVALVVVAGIALLMLRRSSEIRAPRPESSADDGGSPPFPSSTLTVPIVADLSSVVGKLEKAVPQSRGSLEDRKSVEDNDRLDVAYELHRGPFQAEFRGDVARLRTVIEYRGRVWYDPPVLPTISAACAADPDDPAPRAVVELTSPLWLTSDWRLGSRPRVSRVAPVSDTDRDRCRLTVLDFDVTDRVMRAARDLIEGKLSEIQSALADLDLRSSFTEWWSVLNEPIELGEDVWLLLDPEGVAQGETSGSGTTLTANTTLSARPRLVVGPRPIRPARPLPPLDTASTPTGLTIRAMVSADYATATARLNERLAGRTLSLSGHPLRIQRLDLSGLGGGRVALEVWLEGAARGNVFLVGTPAHDDEAGEIHVPDLDFDLATANVLVGGAAWLAHDELAAFLRASARWPAGNLSEIASRYLEKGLNSALSDRVRLEGHVDSVRITAVHATRRALELYADAAAHATLVVERQ